MHRLTRNALASAERVRVNYSLIVELLMLLDFSFKNHSSL
ncbi:hypothetical protein LOKVESSMR4R_02547 [Yoonia vestfoldensis]|uniref:Uncharacterized protein n=1 Tax=Yoonia vestfoldensis TaxID=245188 RepID=A0A1Y0EEJ8_9RHOB|nr:hypothetical protein LOKVESSMR4R_02547 [Yoonia vestfoldensis]